VILQKMLIFSLLISLFVWLHICNWT